ncbi:MAG: DNA polymerase/3'-5' exonuclease PolX [Candidatus Omnitrophota bacterium]
MKNKAIAGIFREIAELLELQGEGVFRIRAYQKAAQVLESLPEDIEEVAKEDRLQDIPGIGKDLAAKIKEFISSGTLSFLEELKEDIPKGLLDVLKVPGIGPKTARLLYEKLNILDIVMLERLAATGKIRALPGIKEKTEENILRGIELLKRGRERMDILTAMDAAAVFIEELKNMKEVERIDPAGSLRRMKDTVKDIDILIASDKAEKIMDKFTGSKEVKDILAKGPTKASIVTKDNIQVDLRVIKKACYGSSLMYFTGSKSHNIRLRKIAIKKGLKLNEYGLFKKDKMIAGTNELDVYKALGLDYIEPELREDRGEIELSLKGKLPDLVKLTDIKGDLHVHSTWSDGGSSIEEIVKGAIKAGYEYIAITDHSKSLKIAGGLSEKSLMEKKKEILRLSRIYKDIKILCGSEVDIDLEGGLDYTDDILKEVDVVIAAIHTGFKQSKEKITKRIVRACSNKYVDIIAHPTGRLWGARDAYDIDLEEVFRVCKEYDVALEINSFPQRLDLNDINSRMAKEKGVKIAIDTDSHSVEELSIMKLGVACARRGYLEKKDILNCLSFKALKNRLSH